MPRLHKAYDTKWNTFETNANKTVTEESTTLARKPQFHQLNASSTFPPSFYPSHDALTYKQTKKWLEATTSTGACLESFVKGKLTINFVLAWSWATDNGKRTSASSSSSSSWCLFFFPPFFFGAFVLFGAFLAFFGIFSAPARKRKASDHLNCTPSAQIESYTNVTGLGAHIDAVGMNLMNR